MNHLIAQYKQLLDFQDSRFSFIEHEDAMVAVVYKVTVACGKEYVLKVCSRLGDYIRETYFLNPGSLMRMTRDEPLGASFAIYDTRTNLAEHYELI